MTYRDPDFARLAVALLLSILPARAALANPETLREKAHAVVTDGQRLKRQLDQQVMQAQSLGTVQGTTAGALRAELPATERAFQSWKSDVEALLSATSDGSPNAADELDWKTGAISSYFARAVDLLDLRARIGLKTAADTTRLRISLPVLGELTGMAQISEFKNAAFARSMLDQADALIRVEDGPKGAALLALNENIVQTTAMQAAAQGSDKQALLRAVQYTSLVTLADERAHLTRLLDLGAWKTPSFSLPGLGSTDFEKRTAQAERAFDERALRSALAAHPPTLPSVVDKRLVAFALDVSQTKDSTEDIRTKLLQSEKDNLDEPFRALIVSWPGQFVNLATQSSADVREALVSLVIEARLRSLGPALIALKPEASGIDGLNRLIAHAEGTLRASVDANAIERWFNDLARGSRQRQLVEERQALLEQLLTGTRRVQTIEGISLNQLLVDVKTLREALRPVIQQSSFSSATERRVEAILATDRVGAVATYRSTLAALKKRVAADLREARLDTEDSAYEARQDHATLNAEIGELEAVGRLLGMDRGQFRVTKELETEYRHAAIRIALANPLLTAALGNGKMLYEALHDYTPRDEALALVGEALTRTLQENQQRATQVSHARTIEEIQPLVTQSNLIREQLRLAFPALTPVRDEAVHAYATAQSRHGILARTAEAYQAPLVLLMPVFALDLAAAFLRPTRPLVRGLHAFHESMSPYIGAYMMTTLPLIGFKLKSEWSAYDEAQRIRGDVDALFHTGLSEAGLTTYADVEEAKSHEEAAYKELRNDVLFNAVFFLASPFRNAGKRLLMRLQDRAFERQFQTLGAADEQMSWKKGAIEELATQRVGAVMAEAATLNGRAKLAKLREVERVHQARDSLLKAAAAQEKRLAVVFRDFQDSFKALGTTAEQTGFNVEKIEDALNAVRAAAAKGQATARQAQIAERKAAQLIHFVHTEWTFVQPMALSRLVGQKKPSDVRGRLYQDIYDFWSSVRRPGTEAKTSKDYYAALGVRPDASKGDIRNAYRRLALETHADHAGGDPAKHERYLEINEAYQVLSNDAKRASYDLMRMVRADEAA